MRKDRIFKTALALAASLFLGACAQNFSRKVVVFEDGSSGEVEIYKASEKSDFAKSAEKKFNGGEFSPNNYAFESKLLVSFYQDEQAGISTQPDSPGSRSVNLVFLMELGQSFGVLPGTSHLGKGGSAAAILFDIAQPDSPKERFEKNRYNSYQRLVSPHLSLYRIDPITDGNYLDEYLDTKMARIFVDVRKIVKGLPYSCNYRREIVSMGVKRSLSIIPKCIIDNSEQKLFAESRVIRPTDEFIETVIRDVVGPHIITMIRIEIPSFKLTDEVLKSTKPFLGTGWYAIYPKEASESERIVVIEHGERLKEFRVPITARMK